MPMRQLSPEPGFDPAARPSCRAAQHEPPVVALRPGTYEWTCPACGARRVFSVVDGEVIR